MTSKTLCAWVRCAVVAAAVCVLIICGMIVPVAGREVAFVMHAYRFYYLPWLILVWIASLPCFAILVLVWKVSGAIKNDEVFSRKTAVWIKTGAILLFADAGLFFAGNIAFAIADMNGAPILLFSLIACILMVALALLAAVLARYVTKAAELREVSEGTI